MNKNLVHHNKRDIYILISTEYKLQHFLRFVTDHRFPHLGQHAHLFGLYRDHARRSGFDGRCAQLLCSQILLLLGGRLLGDLLDLGVLRRTVCVVRIDCGMCAQRSRSRCVMGLLSGCFLVDDGCDDGSSQAIVINGLQMAYISIWSFCQ